MPYDLSKAFEAIEDELISSIMRNLKRHQAEETDQGFEWEQWQALQLKALEEYRRNNQKKFPQRFRKLNLQIDELLKNSYNDGRTAQERIILEAVRKGFKNPVTPFSGDAVIEGTFFQVNDRKLDALIEATTHDMERAEYAVLRRADDQYRQVIFNAQVYANTGAGTYKKAVDMATRDFLRAGLDCVEYKNGSRHTLEDYSDMAIKTASKRAYLQGEGGMRDEWNVPTVIMNKRNCPCPKCLPFVGKVFIDDVWSGADKSGISPVTGVKYPLLSEAIAQGLYHPRCKDVHSTYFEGVSTPPEDSQYTADELDELAQQYDAEQKQGYCERQEKRYDRISKYSLDEDNQRIYGARAQAWGERAEQYEKLAGSFEKTKDNASESLSVQYPKGFTDTRQTGEKISETDLIKFVEQVSSSGFSFMPLAKSQYGGFETYRGDTSVLDEMLKHLRENQKILTELSGDGKIVLGYDYIKESGAVDVGTFACTHGRTIIFNKFMYDDSKYLVKEYADAVKQGKFAKGTTYLNIPDHECGHLFARNNKRYISALRQVCEKRAELLDMTYEEFVKNNISSYALFNNELPAEINAMKKGSDFDFALSLLKEAGLK